MLIAQLSDPHITHADQWPDKHFRTADHLSHAVTHLMTLPTPPDVVVITGDCVQDGNIAEYERFQELLQPLTMPVYIVPGNHDDRHNIRQLFGDQGTYAMDGFIQYVIDDWPVRLIALDTLIPGQVGGRLCQARLHWLDQRLAEEPGRPTIIFQHHPPFPIGIHAIDHASLEGAEELGSIATQYATIERILAGHVHRLAHRRFYGTIAQTCPSTAQQTPLDLRTTEPGRWGASTGEAACLLHLWRPETGLVTHMSYIGEAP